MNEQLTLWQEGPAIFDHFDRTMDKTHQPGMKVWTGALRDWFADLIGHRERAYQELMQLEMEVEQGKRKQALVRLGRIKGMLAVVCFGLLSLSIWQVGEQEVRRPRGGVRIVRVSREDAA